MSDPTEPRPIVVLAAVVERAGRFLVTRRLRGTHLEGYWEFPGGKCEVRESAAECLAREIREELDVGLIVGPEIFTTRRSYPEQSVELHFYSCRLQGEPRSVLGQEMRWVPREQLRELQFPPADQELIDRLARSLQR
jgi:mutator protein MutT